MPSLSEMPSDEIEQFLDEQKVGRLGCHEGGTTHVVPLIYAREDEALSILTTVGEQIRVMRQNAAVCFEIDEYDDATGSWRSVIVQGRYEELDSDEGRGDRDSSRSVTGAGAARARRPANRRRRLRRSSPFGSGSTPPPAAPSAAERGREFAPRRLLRHRTLRRRPALHPPSRQSERSDWGGLGLGLGCGLRLRLGLGLGLGD